MKKHFVCLMLKSGERIDFPQATLDMSVETVRIFYETLGPMRPIGQWGIVHQASVMLLYAYQIEKEDEGVNAVREVRSGEHHECPPTACR